MLTPAADLIRLSLHVLAATIWIGGQSTLAGLVPRFASIAGTCQAYVCGPPGMVRTAEAGLAAVGVAAGRLNTEEWD